MTVELRTTRHFATTLAAGCTLATFLGQGVAQAQQVGPVERITAASPFSGCTADDVAGQDGVNYPNTEIEPWVDANPSNPLNLIAGWQQDRWSNGGGRGNPAAVSRDGGATWRVVTLPRASKCTGGVYLRNSDPWLSFSPNGTAYYMTLAFDPDLPSGSFGRNAMLVNRSTNGGSTWSNPIALIRDPAGQALNDKNSLTADPTNSAFVYAVWDRIQDFTLPPAGRDADAAAAGRSELGMDGLAITRERVKRLKARAKSGAPVAADPLIFKGPTYLARTVNGGRSWQPARVIYDPGANRQTIGNIVRVLPDGTVINFFTNILQNGALRLSLIRSNDKGRTFERQPTVITTVNDTPTATITPNELESVRDANILFSVTVNPENGRIYIVWQDARFRGVDEVAYSESRDRGRTWSRPVRINQTPNNRNPLRQQAFIPSVVVAENGTLVVTYYDFRRDDNTALSEKTDHWAVFCRANCTQRASWGDEERLTTFSFNMLDAPIARGHFLGDYVGLVAARDGRVHPVYGVATRDDVTNLYTRTIGFPRRVAQAP